MNAEQPTRRKSATSTSAPGVVYLMRNRQNKDEKALTLDLDKDFWLDDPDRKKELRALAAFRHAEDNSDAWFAVAVQDFGFQMPRQSELINGALERLKKQFGDSLQFEDAFTKTTLFGESAQRFPFRGRTNVVWNGECFLIGVRGLAYWVFVAGTDADSAEKLLAVLGEEGAVTLSVDRRGWREETSEIKTFAARQEAFEVKASAGIWQKHDPQTDDPDGEIFLGGAFVNETDRTRAANLFGIRIDKIDDLSAAYAKGRSLFETKLKATATDYAIIPNDPAEPDGKRTDVGDVPGAIGELRLLRGGELMRYWLLAVVNDETSTYVLRFECAWDRRIVWKQEFVDVLKTFRLTKK